MTEILELNISASILFIFKEEKYANRMKSG